MAEEKAAATLTAFVAREQLQLDGMPNFEQLQAERKRRQSELAVFAPVIARLPTERAAAEQLATDLKTFLDHVQTLTSAELENTTEAQLQASLEAINAAIKKAEEQVNAQQTALDANAAMVAQKEAVVRTRAAELDSTRTAIKQLPDGLRAAAAAAKRHQAAINVAIAAGQMRKAYVLALLMKPDLELLRELVKPENEQNLLTAYQSAAKGLLTAQDELSAAQTARANTAETLKAAQTEQKQLRSAYESNIQALYSPQPLPSQ